MTEPEGPTAPGASGPTPEEISARLEALLKRTHALRAQQPPVNAGGPLTITWPPPDRELDHYDVVDVPDESAMANAVDLAAAEAPPAQVPEPPVDVEPAPPVEAAPLVAPVAPPAGSTTKSDWTELRLRTPAEEASGPSMRGRVIIVVLALATVLQAGYIWYLQSATPVLESGRIRVDGPDGAEVRIDGRSIGAAPVEHNLEAGDYDVELVQGGRVVRADRVSVGPGRTVLLLAPAGADAASATGGAVPGSGQGGATAPGGPARNPDLVSDTTGAVTIESTPPGLPVTMGGRPRGVTPLTLGKIPPGRHDVLVGSAARQVDVTAGEVATLRVPR